MSEKSRKQEIKKHRELPGVTRTEEEKYLAETIQVAQRNLDQAQEGVKKLKEDLEELREIYDAKDKEGRFLWNNAKAQFKENLNALVRYEKARKKPYFGRIDFQDSHRDFEECYYIGRVGIARTATEPAVIDWRTPVASVYYENTIGRGTYTVSSEGTFEIDLKRKRSYEIEGDELKDFYDLDVVANDELLTKYLSKNKTEVLGEIIATIQKEQNRIIRRSPKTNMIVQGVAGSGKTTVAMHRISYILYNYEDEFRPEDFYIIGSNKILLNYITSVLPELDVYGVKQMTMEQLFIRLLYEDWDANKYSCHTLDKKDTINCVKGSQKWFTELEEFCRKYEKAQICSKPIFLEKTKELLLETERIESYLQENPTMSMQSKCLMLNEILYSRYENIILGKHISFTAEEKKEMEKTYRFYFGKGDWKGSIYELYQMFLMQQMENGYTAIEVSDTSFDVYDLAALAYLYKRIKEIDPIREATHIVIDEAQDFGMMAYCALHFCIRGCTYTIMGDTSQNIHFDYGLNDWDNLRKLILTGLRDKFCLLRKSYRNTVEIADFATEILRHGDFSIYPVEPIIRHGSKVRVEAKTAEELLPEAVKTIQDWKKQGYETIAVVCRDEEEAASVSLELQKYLEIKTADLENAEFGSGVMVLPVVYTKGLEFDAVLVFDPSKEKYPADNGHVKMLYVTATRALHELTILHTGNLTPLLGTKVPKDKHLEEFGKEDLLDEGEDILPNFTEKELIEQGRKCGQIEMEERKYIGPQRIVIETSKQAESSLASKKTQSTDRKQAGSRLATSSSAGSEGNTASTALMGNQSEQSLTPLKKKLPVKRFAAGVAKQAEDDRPVNISPFLYGDTPDNRSLTVKGHSKAIHAVRWVKKTKTYVEVATGYGVLTLTPVTEECIRVSFVKGQLNQMQETYWKPNVQKTFRWSAKESPSAFELSTGKLIVHIEKRDGALHFLSGDRKLLLSEKRAEPRLIDGTETWTFFEADNKEILRSKGILATDLTHLNKKAKYISFGTKLLRMPLILSNKGYGIGIASEKTVMFCGIPMYGQYLYTEGAGQIDYYFMYKGDAQANIELCNQIVNRIK